MRASYFHAHHWLAVLHISNALLVTAVHLKRKKKLTQLVCKGFPSFNTATKEWVNKVNLSSFEIENFFKQIRARVIYSARKAKHLDGWGGEVQKKKN